MKNLYVVCVLIALTSNLLYGQFQDGDINYEVVSAVTLTAQVGSNNELTGDIVIPETVSDGTQTYTVVGVKGWAFSQAEGATSSISSITLPNTVTTIANDAFANCALLSEVNLGDALTYIGVGAFYKAGLASVSLPNSLETIDNVAFFANVNLTQIEFGSGLTSIGSQAFAFCHPLDTVAITATVPPAVQENSFEGLDLAGIGISVPQESVVDYRNAAVWQNFDYGLISSTVDFESSAVAIFPNPVSERLQVSLAAEADLQFIELYNLQGQLLKRTFATSLSFVDQAKGTYIVVVQTQEERLVKQIVKM